MVSLLRILGRRGNGWINFVAMADTRGAATDAMVGTHLGMVANRAHAKAISCRKMLLLVASCFWFLITASLAFSIRFVTRRLFRAKREDDNSQRAASKSSPAQPAAAVTEPAKFGEEDVDACVGEEAPVFQFRFSFQVPGENSMGGREAEGNSHGEDAVSSTPTSIGNNYRFLFERDVSGFLEAPQVITMSVQESYVGSDGLVPKKTQEFDGELRGRRSECADSVAGEDPCGDEDVNNKRILSDDAELGNADILDIEFGDSMSSLKCVREAGEPGDGETAPCRGSNSYVAVPQNTEEVDGELKTRLPEVQAASETCHAPQGPVHGDPRVCFSSWSGGDALDDAEELDRELTTRGGLLRKAEVSGEEEELRLLDGVRSTSAACLPAGACPLPQWKIRSGLDSDTLSSDSLSDGYSVKDLNLELDSEGLLSEGDLEPETDEASLSESNGSDQNVEFLKCDQELEETQLPEPTGSSTDPCEDTNHVVTVNNSDGELAEFNLRQKPGTSSSSESDDENGEQNGRVVETPHGEHWDEPAQRREEPLGDGHLEEDPDRSEETHSREVKELTREESEELESLWEHQDLVEQLRTELRKVRSIGLPTILEESESPKPSEGLKPWMFDGKFLHEDPMDELHRFYKSYRERMRKFDILNYQKMYALGFLQLNGPPQSVVSHEPFSPAITSLLSHNIWRRRRKSGGGDPSEKLVKELQSDLETVYVGQACLSWEFLSWQCERRRELLDPDLQGDGRRYNQVGGEFQQLQVLIQRFLEDEPFQGPRVLNYVKNRCVIRSLLQVPMVREDCFKGKAEEKSNWEADGVTCDELECVVGKSIRVFWEFVKADKDDTPAVVKGLIGTTPSEPQDPADRNLMADIQADLRKKEKKLRDITRAGNCLVRKFKKPRDGRSIDQDDLLLISLQVDMKLVSRVLRMTRLTTDQLVWCHQKLSNIGFVDRKLVREPSFLLFPC